MHTNSQKLKKHKIYSDDVNLKDYMSNQNIIVCIGTDKIICDSLGPIVGTILKHKLLPMPVYGTLENPIHAMNIEKEIQNIKDKHPNAKIIAIDACAGDANTIGDIRIRPFAINPGKAVGKSINKIGDISIIGIVADKQKLNGDNPFPSARLSFILSMAKTIANNITKNYKKSTKQKGE